MTRAQLFEVPIKRMIEERFNRAPEERKWNDLKLAKEIEITLPTELRLALNKLPKKPSWADQVVAPPPNLAGKEPATNTIRHSVNKIRDANKATMR